MGSHISVLYDERIWTSKLSIQIDIKSSKFLSFDFLRRPVKKDNFLKESKVVMNWESKMPSPAFLLEILLHFFLQNMEWNLSAKTCIISKFLKVLEVGKH